MAGALTGVRPPGRSRPEATLHGLHSGQSEGAGLRLSPFDQCLERNPQHSADGRGVSNGQPLLTRLDGDDRGVRPTGRYREIQRPPPTAGPESAQPLRDHSVECAAGADPRGLRQTTQASRVRQRLVQLDIRDRSGSGAHDNSVFVTSPTWMRRTGRVRAQSGEACGNADGPGSTCWWAAGDVDNIILALVAALFGEPSFRALKLDLGGTDIPYGNFLTDLVGFLLLAPVVLMLVKATKRITGREAAGAQGSRECYHCTSSIPVDARVRMYCTRDVAPLVT